MTKRSGFTALELVIVLSIVGLAIASIVIGVGILKDMPDEPLPKQQVAAPVQEPVVEVPEKKAEPIIAKTDATLDVPSTNAEFSMGLPIDCEVGVDCFIQNYVDRTEFNGATDFACGKLTYDGHKGTDFALRTLADMKNGVNILAAADGVVRGVRDGMADKEMNSVKPASIKDRECGNGLAIQHGNGWETQYCHMKNGSLKVKQGDSVTKGQVLGQVGLSGKTEFPHLHISVRKGDTHIDPFTATNIHGACGVSIQKETLWDASIIKSLDYTPTGYVAAGFNDAVPDSKSILKRKKTTSIIGSKAPAFIYWTEFYGVQTGDILQLSIKAPDGKVMTEMKETIKAPKVRYYKYIGKKNRASLAKGEYVASYSLMRGDKVIAQGQNKVVVK